jgi:hypothetical protein
MVEQFAAALDVIRINGTFIGIRAAASAGRQWCSNEAAGGLRGPVSVPYARPGLAGCWRGRRRSSWA